MHFHLCLQTHSVAANFLCQGIGHNGAEASAPVNASYGFPASVSVGNGLTGNFFLI
jgi:hypothetical protein